jgi:SAM-dependent methyltransferase
MCPKAKRYGRPYFESFLRRRQRNSQRNRNRLELIRRYEEEGCLLEIGCGRGEFLQVASERFTVEGIDISQYAVQAVAADLELPIRRADIEESALPEVAYDVVVAFNVLEHLAEPLDVLRKIHRALQAGGLFVGSVPYNGALVGRIHTSLTNLFDKTHVSTYPPERWRALLQEADFEEIEFFGELMLGRHRNWYLHGRWWPLLALNLMFIARK